ncbi:TRAP transporter substrate-binding protein DctP [Saccharopolyspora montiporae]|uniref:TRAP transporter substrate-binding protein DctP n=1 Tax=Saccharopolyspora montiporae TaxID=2781240 RepID=UPI001882B98C
MLATVAVSGCSKADSAGVDNSGGKGLPPGATKAQYQAAFEDVEPIELSFQVASSNPEAYSSMRDVEFAQSLEEWSNGKIDVQIHYAGAITEPTETPDALVDGRLDLAHYYTTYEPNEMPAFVDLSDSMVQVPSTPLVGELVLHAAFQEMVFRTPEIIEEFEDRGMHVLAPASSFGVTEMICNSERGSLADLENAQIRGNAHAHETEIDALGGTISSVELAEGYEAFQRGVLDCSLQAPATAESAGWLDAAPHVYFPRSQGFAPGPGSLVAGASWDQLPLVAQQLMSDRMKEYMSAELYGALQSIDDTVVETAENGGSAQYLDAESEAALSRANEDLLADVENSPVLAGEALNADVAESIHKWTAITDQLGYTEDGDVANFDDWYQGSAKFEDRSYLEPITNRLHEEAFLPERPR